MKLLHKILILAALTPIIIYLTGSFMVLSWDVNDWKPEARQIVGLIMGLLMIFALVIGIIEGVKTKE